MIKDYAFHPKQQWMARVLDALRRAQPALGWSAVVLVPVTGIAASVTDAAQERSRELARATAGLAEVAPDLTCSALPLQDRDPPRGPAAARLPAGVGEQHLHRRTARTSEGRSMARILVVDDDPDILGLVGRLLRKRGHLVITVGSPQEALHVLDTKSAPDILVSDVSMPGMTGMELVTQMRTRDSLRDLPVLFLSARADSDDIETGPTLGATYLTQPFIANALFTAIDKVLTPVQEGTW